jgi:hypothetical protein
MILGDIMHEFVALLLFTGTDATGLCRRVRLVYDDEVWAVGKEGSAAGIALHEVHAHDQVLVVPIDAQVTTRQVSFQPRQCAGAHDLGMNMELRF